MSVINTPERLRRLLWHDKIIITPSGCWEWTGSRYNTGYGEIWCGGRRCLAHRVSYELVHGPIPNGLFIRHSCDNPPCVNPEHLLAGTQMHNMHDMRSRNRASHVPRAWHEKNGMAVLTFAEVEEIKTKYATDLYTMKQLGDEYGTHLSNISLIINGKAWKPYPVQAGS